MFQICKPQFLRAGVVLDIDDFASRRNVVCMARWKHGPQFCDSRFDVCLPMDSIQVASIGRFVEAKKVDDRVIIGPFSNVSARQLLACAWLCRADKNVAITPFTQHAAETEHGLAVARPS